MGQHNYTSREVIIITDLRNQIDCLQFKPNHSKLKTPLEGNFKAIKAWQTSLKIMCSPCSSRRTRWLGNQNDSRALHMSTSSRAWSLQMLTQQAWAEVSDSCKCTPSGGGGGGPEGLERFSEVCCLPTQEKGVGKCVPSSGGHYPHSGSGPSSLTNQATFSGLPVHT